MKTSTAVKKLLSRKSIFISLLFFVSLITQAEVVPKTLTVWVFNALHSPITRSKVQGFFDNLSEKTHYRYELNIDNKISPLLQDCINGKPDIIFASQPIINQVMSKCDYIRMAKTEQKVHLFVKTDSNIHSPDAIKRIGLIRGGDASQVAEKELSQINEHYQAIIYPTIYEMISNLKEDKIDSIAFPKSILKVAPVLASEWHSIHVFNETAVIELIASAHLEKHTVRAIQQKLLNSDPSAVGTWQERVGFGAFSAPD